MAKILQIYCETCKAQTAHVVTFLSQSFGVVTYEKVCSFCQMELQKGLSLEITGRTISAMTIKEWIDFYHHQNNLK